MIMGFLFPSIALSAKRPALMLFPKNVTENIQDVSETSRQMEEGLEPVIHNLNTQMELFRASNCEGDDTDVGCLEIKQQIVENYSQMLGILEKNLPELDKKIRATNISLGNKISREVGAKLTPAGLQNAIGDGALPPVIKGRARLSRVFSRYHRLISKHGTGNKAIATMAAEMYLDNQAAQEWIEYINADIAQQQVFLVQVKQLGVVSDAMIESVKSIQDIIFPEDSNLSDIPNPGLNSQKRVLELDK